MTERSSLASPDPRFGVLARYAGQVTLTTGAPGPVKTMSMTRAKSVALSDPNDPLSVVSTDEQTTVNGKTWSEHYHAPSRTLTVTTPLGFVASTTFDTLGRVVSATSPGLEPTTVTYDSVFPDRVHSVTVGTTSPRTQTFSYFGAGPSAGLPSGATLPNDAAHGTGLTYDLAHRPTSVAAPDGATVLGMGWDDDGRLTSWTTPKHDVHSQSYDLIGQLDQHTWPTVAGSAVPVTDYVYGLDRRLDTITRPDGHVIAFGYDPVTGKPTSIDFHAGTADDSIVFGYYLAGNDLGKLATVTRGSVTSAFEYSGRLTQAYTMSGDVFGASASLFTVTQTHDNDLRVTSETLNQLPSISYTYDADSAPSSVGGLVIARDLPAPQGNGTGLPLSLTLGNVALVAAYDEIGQPMSETTSVQGAPLYAESFVRDASGRIVQRTETIEGQTTTYGYVYDLKGQLRDVSPSGAPTLHYDYDLNGNRDPAPLGPAVYDEQDRLVSYGGEPYTYTPAGELESVGAGAQQTTYVYDDLGQLATVHTQLGVTYEYVIDGLGRRVARLVDGVVERGWIYGGGGMPIAELDGTGGVRALFAYATGGAPDVMWTVSGGVVTGMYRVVKDHLGSVRLVVDAASSGAAPTIMQRIDYDAWGKVLADSSPGFQPFGFAGGLYDADTGLVRFGARDYDAGRGRWTSRDPIGLGGGDADLYRYVGNDPVNFVDPMGLAANPAMASATNGGFLSWLGFGLFANGVRDRSDGIAAIGRGDVERGARQAGRGACEMAIGGGAISAAATVGVGVAGAVVQAGGAAARSGGWTLGTGKSATKWEGQMAKRGWVPDQITEALQRGKQFPAENLVNKGNAATRYVHPETGRSVVLDDITKEVIHVGGDGFNY